MRARADEAHDRVRAASSPAIGVHGEGLLRRQGVPEHRGRPLGDRRGPRRRRLQRRRARRRARRRRRPGAARLPRQQQERSPRSSGPSRSASASIVIDSCDRDRARRGGRRRGTARRRRCVLRVNSGVHAADPRVPGDRARGPEVRLHARRRPGCVAAHPRDRGARVPRPALPHRLADLRRRRASPESAARLSSCTPRCSPAAPVPELNLGGGFGIAYTAVDEPTPIERARRRHRRRRRAPSATRRGIPVPDSRSNRAARSSARPASRCTRSGTIKAVEVSTRRRAARPPVRERRRRHERQRAPGAVRRRLLGADRRRALATPPPCSCASSASTASRGDIVVDADYLPGRCRAGRPARRAGDRRLLLVAREQLQLPRPPAGRRRARRRGARDRARRDRSTTCSPATPDSSTATAPTAKTEHDDRLPPPARRAAGRRSRRLPGRRRCCSSTATSSPTAPAPGSSSSASPCATSTRRATPTSRASCSRRTPSR